jgi:hypothetical protein
MDMAVLCLLRYNLEETLAQKIVPKDVGLA